MHDSHLLRPSTGLALLLLTVTLSSCGGGGGDVGAAPGREGVEEVVPVYTAALADGDGPRACSLMTVDAQDQLVADTGTADCLHAVIATSQGLSPEAANALRDVTVRRVEVTDNAATVSLGEDGEVAARALGGSTLQLVREEEHWLVGPNRVGRP